MNSSIGASIFYSLSFIITYGTILFFPKTEKKQNLVTGLALSVVIYECMIAFTAAVINVVHIPVNLVSLGLINLLIDAFLILQMKVEGKRQQYTIDVYEIIFSILLIAVVLYIANVHYGLNTLAWNYRASDPGARYYEAIQFVKTQKISRMFFAQLVNGSLMAMLSPFVKFDYWYKIYVLGDILQLILSGFVFYGVAKNWLQKKDHFAQLLTIIASFIYLLGYPLNSTFYGFTYLGMSLYMIAAMVILTDTFLRKEYVSVGKISGQVNGILLLMIFCHALFQCYVLFMPAVFLAMGLAFLLRQFKDKKLFSVNTLVTGLGIFLIPIILGFYYTYMDVFVKDDVTVGNALAAKGAIYKDFYSNFLFFVPIALFALYVLYKKRENSFLAWFTPIFAVFILGMFLVGYKTEKVSAYYYYKNYYLMWMVVFLLIVYAIANLDGDGRKTTVFYLCSWAFVAVLFYAGIENKIEERNPLYIADNKSMRYNDLMAFNKDTLTKAHYSDQKMELIHYVYDNLMENGESETPIPVCSTQDEVYLYRAMTWQTLEDFEYWRSHEADDHYFLSVAADCEYACVFTDCDLYTVHQEFWDQLDVIYENGAGRIVKIPEGKLKYWK